MRSTAGQLDAISDGPDALRLCDTGGDRRFKGVVSFDLGEALLGPEFLSAQRRGPVSGAEDALRSDAVKNAVPRRPASSPMFGTAIWS